MSASSNATRKKHSNIDNPEIDITREEFSRIREALEKEDFRKLFLEYIEEIQDPENRKLYEKEIIQFEKERGVDVTFIHPEPGFVVQTSIDGVHVGYINIAKNKHISPPSSEAVINPANGSRGLNWAIPLAQAAPRDDFEDGKRCRVYDVIFHPDALYLGQRNSTFRKCLIETAFDAVEREYKVTLDRTNWKIPSEDYKGIARPILSRKNARDAAPETQEPHPLDHLYPPRPPAEGVQPTVWPMKTQPATKPEFTTPKYVIKHSRDIDLAECTYELDAKLNLTVPRALIIEIELPLLNSTADCQLDVTDKSIYFLSERPCAKYRLKLDLPYTCNSKDGNARFETDTRRLNITLPVIRKPMTSDKPQSMHDMLRHMSREDSGVELHSNSESPVEEEEEEEEDLSDSHQKIVVISNSDNSITANTPNPTTTTNPKTFLKNTIHYQFPSKFDCNVLDEVMSLVLHVRNVQPESIATLQQSKSLHIQFMSVGSGYYPTYYAFYLQLPNAVNIEISTVEAEAWENNLVINLNLNTTSEQLQHYLAGLNSNDLKEYTVHGKFQIVNTARQRKHTPPHSGRTTPLASSLNVSVERSECERSLEIEIKPIEEQGMSTCNANTTEDDESQRSDTQQQTQKKLNKKQRKKNKKRRSLSESACDDIKAYDDQQQQQKQQQQQQKQHQQKITKPQQMEDDEDSSPERIIANDLKQKTNSAALAVPTVSSVKLTEQQRKQRSYSECHDSVQTGSSAGSACAFKSILKRHSRYEPRSSISDSILSIEDCYSSYSRSADAAVTSSLHYSQSFGGIPEENDGVGLSESCKKTVRFNDNIMKQVFRIDSSILGQRKKNQKRRDRKQRALHRRLSEGDSADYEENESIEKSATNTQYFKLKANNSNSGNNNTNKLLQHDSGLDLTNNNSSNNDYDENDVKLMTKFNNKTTRAHLDSFSSDQEANKNSLMFEMDDDM